MLVFELTMPSNNAWDGKWTGDGDYYARVRHSRGLHPEAIVGSYHYNFGDGWVTCVTVRLIDYPEARKIRNRTKGFCGYEWMIDSILAHGKIQVAERVTP